jgi:hypothetical protein
MHDVEWRVKRRIVRILQFHWVHSDRGLRGALLLSGDVDDRDAFRRGSIGSLSSASTPNTHSCSRQNGSPATKRSSDSTAGRTPAASPNMPSGLHRLIWCPMSSPGCRPLRHVGRRPLHHAARHRPGSDVASVAAMPRPHTTSTSTNHTRNSSPAVIPVGSRQGDGLAKQ